MINYSSAWLSPKGVLIAIFHEPHIPANAISSYQYERKNPNKILKKLDLCCKLTTCVGQSSRPSKMCVAYIMVAPRSSHSFLRYLKRSALARTSKSTVISSRRRTYKKEPNCNSLGCNMILIDRYNWVSQVAIA